MALGNSFFSRATRLKSRARIALDGPPGSGKSFTALRFAFALAAARHPQDFDKRIRVAVINSESGAIQKYSGLSPDGIPWEFDCGDLHSFAPTEYTAKIMMAGQAGYDVLIVDSLSHAWEGTDGALELVSKKGGNSYTAWKDVTPLHRRMVDSILMSPCDVICTMRSKIEHVLEEQVNAQGKTIQVPRKIGMAPIQRQGLEYEFDLYCSMDWSHTMTVTKSRCPAMDGLIAVKPNASTIEPFVTWLLDGVDAPPDYYACTDEDIAKAYEFRIANDPEFAKKEAEERRAAAAAKQAERMRGKMSGGAGGAAAASVVGLTPTAPAATNGHKPTTGAADNSNGTRHTNGTVATAASDRVDNENSSTTPPAGQEAANAESVKETAKATARTAKPKLATRAQLNEIRQLFATNEVTTEQQAAILEFYGVTEIAKLPIEKAAECIENLKCPAGEAADAAEQPPANEPPFDADAATATTPAPTSDVADIYKPAEEWAAKKDAAMQAAAAENGGLATAAQLQRINEIAERCGWDAAAQAEYLQGVGASAFANLTVADADDLISELVRIELESAAGVVPPN